MNELLEFLKTDEVRIAVAVAISICIVGTLYFVIERVYQNRKRKHNTKELNDLVERLEMENQDQSCDTPVLEQIITPSTMMVKEKQVEKEPVITSSEPVKRKEEIPQVIPIEEFQKNQTIVVPVKEEQPTFEREKVLVAPTQTIEEIYEKVKDEVELLEIEEPKEKEELKYTSREPNPEEAKEEIRKVTEELMKAQESQVIDLTQFEEEQEKNAIISVEELMEKGNTLYEQNEVVQYEDEGNEPISLEDLEKRMNVVKQEARALEVEEEAVSVQEEKKEDAHHMVMDDFYSVSTKPYQEDHVFQSSPIISPIFGIEKQETIENNLELENTANYEKLDEEIRKTNEFLATLRELQKNLE